MPGSFMSMGGCLFSMLAWAGICCSILSAVVSAITSLLRKNNAMGIIWRVVCCVLPIMAMLLIIANVCHLSDVRAELGIRRSAGEIFRYLPQYEYDGYYVLSFPITAAVNINVRELRITTVIMLITGIAAMIALLLSRRLNRHRDNKKPIGGVPLLICGVGGLAAIVTHIIFVVFIG